MSLHRWWYSVIDQSVLRWQEILHAINRVMRVSVIDCKTTILRWTCLDERATSKRSWMSKANEKRTAYRLCCQDNAGRQTVPGTTPVPPPNSWTQEIPDRKFALPISKVNAVDMIGAARFLGSDSGRRSVSTMDRRTPTSLLPCLLFSKEFSSTSSLMEYKGFRPQEERNSMAYSRVLHKKKQPAPQRRVPITKNFVQVLDISKPINLCSRYTANPESQQSMKVE